MSRNESSPELRVLYLHPVGAFGGASRSLLELVQSFAPGAVEARVVVPRGSAADLFEQHGFATLRTLGIPRFDTTRYSHYRGLRWLIILRELYLWPFALLALWRAARRWPDTDLIHANELVAVLPALFAKKLLRKPLVVHVRSVQEEQRGRRRRAFMSRLLERHADAVVAIDETVRASLPRSVRAVVIHNGFTARPSSATPAAVERLRAGLHSGALRVGMVGTLLAYKGVFEFLEAARLVLSHGANVDFVLVGSNTRRMGALRAKLLQCLGFAQDMEAAVQRFIAAHRLEGRVHAIEFLSDVNAVYEQLDVLCFPSHLDAIGRPVIEAAWNSIPSIVAVEEPLPDTFVPGETGLQIRPHDPRALADAVLHFAGNRAEIARMGQAALRLAQRNFDSARNAARMLEIYAALVPGRRAA